MPGAAGNCPGEAGRNLTGFGFRRSCSSRRRFKRSSRITSVSWNAFPTYKRWQSQPKKRSFGRYTAGAISSIAFNQPYPVVDGNVKRVVSRLHGIRHTVPESFYWKQAEAWVPEGSASNFNQAVMELGALVCTASAPLCLLCPVHSLCEARRLGIQDTIPPARAARPAESISFVMLALEREGRILLVRQRGGSFIPGKWGLPTNEIRNHASPAQAASDLAQSIASFRFPLAEKCVVRHSITHRKIFIYVFYGRIPRLARARAPDSRWVSRPALDRFLTSSAFKKALSSALSE